MDYNLERMAKKKSKKSSNSYWMKFGGNTRKMHDGGFPHPHPHPKNASDNELKGAQLWSTHHTDGDDGERQRLNKRKTYSWDGEGNQDAINSFRQSRWFDFFPDTSKNTARTKQELEKYETAIDAHKTRTIELYDTKFDDFSDLLYASSNVLRGTAAAMPSFTPQTLVGKGALFAASYLPTAAKAGWDWYKRDWNTKTKDANPGATFVDPEGNILNYGDGEHSLFNTFANWKTGGVEKNVRVKPSVEELEEMHNTINRDTKPESTDPLLMEKKEMGGEAGGNNPLNDPTFKMWAAKNAKRPDVMQSMSNPQALKSLFLNDINFAGNSMPTFSDEIDGYGNIDKSSRSMDLSEQIIGGMQKYGGVPKEKYMYGGMPQAQGKLPKAELGMGQGLYKAPTDGHLSDYSNSGARYDNFGMKMGEVGDSGFMKVFNKVVPGLGTLLDIGMDYWGYKGEKKKHNDLKIDANRSKDSLLALSKPDANKETLDLSTRMGALTNKASYNNEADPGNLWEGWGKEALGDVVSFGVGGGFGDVKGMFAGGDANVVDTGGIGAEDLAPAPSGMSKYGGRPKAGHGGHMAAESGMDLKNLHQMNMGGANNFQPGLTAESISGLVNPLGQAQQFKAQGIEQAYEAGGSVEQNTQDYEAEGGEVIMHAPGEAPSTTANTEALDGQPNEAMLTMLEGKDHEQGGEVVQGGGDQYVFSKSLKSDMWKSNFADAAEKIGKNIERFKKEAENGDGITQSTAASMIEAWNQKLGDLQKEQESARQSKFMEMVEGGAQPQELQEAFPDLFEQFMAEQQEQQGGLSASAMEGQAEMAANPMGDIDMSQLNSEEQQLVGAEYGLPKMETGGFEPYDFNRYFGEIQGEGMFEGVEQGNFELGNDYFGSKGGLMDFLDGNYPDEGYQFGDQTFTNSSDMYDALETDFGTRRNAHLEDYNTSTSRPKRGDYRSEVDGKTDWNVDGKADFKSDKARHSLYNSGLPGNWDENYGRDAGLSRRKYFNALEKQLLADGKSAEEVNSIVKREQLKLQETSELEAVEKENTPLTDEEKAAALVQQMAAKKKGAEAMGFGKNLLNGLIDLAPTLYNRNKAKEGAEVEPFVGNENDAQIEANLQRLSNTDISLGLKGNDDNFNQLKYLARDASDGSSGSMMNTLLRGQQMNNEADAKLYDGKTKADQMGLKIANESLYNLGERDRAEGVRVNTANAENRAAVEAFKAKGWEGLSGYNQLKQKMSNEAGRDEQLKGLLGQIYPDAELYMGKDGSIDLEKLGESGDLSKLMEQYPELKEILAKYL